MDSRSYYKEKNILPKLEQYSVGKTWAFTISPETQYVDDQGRLDKVIYFLKNKLRSPNYEYSLYIELSPSGRIHGHGYLKVFDPFKFVLHDIPYLLKFATLAIEEITDEDGWLEYITKQCHIVRHKIVRLLPKLSDDLIHTTIDEFYAIPDEVSNKTIKF